MLSLRFKCSPLRFLLSFLQQIKHMNERARETAAAPPCGPAFLEQNHAHITSRNFATTRPAGVKGRKAGAGRPASPLVCYRRGGCYRGDNRTASSPTSSTVRGMQIRYSLINIVPVRRRQQQGVWRRLQICKSPVGSALHPNTLLKLCASPRAGVLPPQRSVWSTPPN